MEAGYRCGVPTCRTILALDLHHMVEVNEDGGNEPGNLLALCPTCHALYHRGEIPREAIYSWKGILVALTRAFDTAAIDDLIFLAQLERLQDRIHQYVEEKQKKPNAEGIWTLSRNEGTNLAAATHTPILTGDGILRFTRLIGAGLANFAPAYSLVDLGEMRYEVFLTNTGRLLVDAWRTGNRGAVERALSGGAAERGAEY